MRTPSTVLIPQGSRELPHVTAGETNSRTGWPHVSPRDTPLANSGLQSRGCAPAAGPGYLLTTISPRGSSLVRHHTVAGGGACVPTAGLAAAVPHPPTPLALPCPSPPRQASLGEKVAWEAPFSTINGHHVPTTLCTCVPSCLYLIPETLSETIKW